MMVYGIRWGFGNLLGFAMGGIQWAGSPQRGFEAQERDSRTHVQAALSMDIPKSGKTWGGKSAEASLPVRAQESLQDSYDFRGRLHNMLLDSRGLLVDIRI